MFLDKFGNFEEKAKVVFSFYAVYGFGLTEEGLNKFGFDVADVRKYSFVEFDDETGVFYLNKLDVVGVRSNFKEDLKYSALAYKKIRFYKRIIRFVPFLKMVGVCNNYSFNMMKKNSDIDIFVVVKNGRIFFTRVFLTFVTYLFGLWRHKYKVAGRFCLSFFVVDNSLNLDNIRILPEDIYLDFWIYFISPICGYEVYEKFMMDNDEKVLYVDDGNKCGNFIKRFFEFLFGGFVGNWIEGLFSKIHLKRYLRRKKYFSKDASIVINEKMLKFHNKDARQFVLKRFYEIYDSV